MLKLNARILTQPQIQTGLNYTANVRIGRIPLNGHLFTPKPISALAITYFGANIDQEINLMKAFCETLLAVSLLGLIENEIKRTIKFLLGYANLSCRGQS
jgi:hypothetical protein